MNQKKFKLTIQIYISSDYSDRLELREELDMGEMNFLEMASILGDFSKLARRIKEERGDKKQ